MTTIEIDATDRLSSEEMRRYWDILRASCYLGSTTVDHIDRSANLLHQPYHLNRGNKEYQLLIVVAFTCVLQEV
jgi:hypothetical protein